MSIILDHCVPHKFLKMLLEWGYTASLLQEHTNRDADDQKVIEIVQQQDAVLLTVDMDFSSEIKYPPQNFQGIIVMRYQAKDEENTSKFLKQALQDLYRDRLRGTLVVITSNHYRERR